MSLRTVNRYIAREFLKMWFLCLWAFYLIYLLVDFIERSSRLFKYGANIGSVVAYFAWKTPEIIFQMIPVAVLLGTLITLVILSKNSEITALKAGGISVVRAVSPIMFCAALISLGGFLMNEFIVPIANQKVTYVYRTGIKKEKWRVKYKKRNVYYKSNNSIYRFGLFVPDQQLITDVALYRFNEDFHLIERTVAKSAAYKDNKWHFIDGVTRTFTDDDLTDSAPFDDRVVNIPETPAQMMVYQRKTEEMSFRELRAYTAKLKKEGYDITKYKVDMWGKLSFPLVSLIMALLGIPFAIRHGRSGGVAAGIGIAVVIGVVYWIVLAMALAMGHSGALNPIIAAWGSHFLFGAIGIYMLTRVDQ